MGVRGKLLLVSLGLIAVSVVSADLYLGAALDGLLSERIGAELQGRLRLIERQVSGAPTDLGDLARWDELARELGRASGTRVTIIRLDGTVVGDSDVSTPGLSVVENHASRPEVVAALAGRVGSDRRMSATVGKWLLYMAMPFRRQGRIAGVVRAAVPLTEVERALSGLHRCLAVAAFLALAVSGLMSWGAAHLMVRALRQVTARARRITSAELLPGIDAPPADEIGQLDRTLDQVAANLSRSLDDLRRERDLLGRILEAMEEGVLVTDEEQTIVMVNKAFRNMMGSPIGTPRGTEAPGAPGTERLVGRPVAEVVRHTHLPTILKATASSQTSTRGEIQLGARQARRLLVHSAPLQGQPSGCVVVLVDVTDIRRLEAVRRNFVANVSHELRTPVTAIRSAVETARGALRQDPAATDQFLQMAERNADRMGRIISDLLDLSRLEAGDLRLKMEPVDVAQVAVGLLDIARAGADARRLRISVDAAPDLPLVSTDRRALEHVLGNLIDNAVKYAGEGGAVTVRLRVDDGGLRLSVEDTGPGIEAKHLPRLFERFYRVDSGRSRDMGGTGLGLSIVKHLTEAMGGSVSATSTVGKGSAFTVTLPLPYSGGA